jgi:hypothetical protein
MFNRYNKDGNMYILLPKHPNYDGEKYQLHFKSGQFMDEEDSMIEDVPGFLSTRFGDLIPFFKEREPELNNIVVFAEDSVLIDLTKKVYEAVMDNFVNDQLVEWEMDDDSYQQYLQAEGYVDDDGDIDWDSVERHNEGWLSYNDEAREWYNDVKEVLGPDPNTIREMATLWGNENDELLNLNNFEYSIAANVSENMSNRTAFKDELIDFINRRIAMDRDDNGNRTVRVIITRR